MFDVKPLAVLAALGLIASLASGCGKEGPLGNTPPQGRPEWMKKDTPPPPAKEP